jgi:hypothetical protein
MQMPFQRRRIAALPTRKVPPVDLAAAGDVGGKHCHRDNVDNEPGQE